MDELLDDCHDCIVSKRVLAKGEHAVSLFTPHPQTVLAAPNLFG